MLFISSHLGGPCPGHVGYVAGRYRDGAASDQWTDVARCSPHTFTRYAGACTCGWRGAWNATDAVGLVLARRSWLSEHLPSVTHAAHRHSTDPTLSARPHSGHDIVAQ